jgi:hypothetical protein
MRGVLTARNGGRSTTGVSSEEPRKGGTAGVSSGAPGEQGWR